MMVLPRYDVEIKGLSFFNFWQHKMNSAVNEFQYDSGTSALIEIIKSLDLPKEAIIGVPLYACSAVWDAVYQTGFEIKFIDIAISAKGYDYNITDFNNIDVLIFIHYFGQYHSNVSEIKEKYRNIILIDDLTHMNFLHDGRNAAVDAAIYSFNFHKPIVAGAGGLGVMYNNLYLEGLKQGYSKLVSPRFFISLKRYVKTYLKNFSYNRFIYSILYPFLLKRQGFVAPTMAIRPIPCRNYHFFKGIIANQAKTYKFDDELVSNYLKIPIKFRLSISSSVTLCYFPVFLRDKEDKVNKLHIFKGMGLDAYVLWENCIQTSQYFGLSSASSYKRTQNILDRIIFLPQVLFLNKNNAIFLQILKVLH